MLQLNAYDSLDASDVVSRDAAQLKGKIPALIALSFTLCLFLDTCPFLLGFSTLLAPCLWLLSVTLHPSINTHASEGLLPSRCVGRGVGGTDVRRINCACTRNV